MKKSHKKTPISLNKALFYPNFSIPAGQKAEKKLEKSHNSTKIPEHEICTYRQNSLSAGKQRDKYGQERFFG
jgi:hypothetical protein